jgi:hypothetical protein
MACRNMYERLYSKIITGEAYYRSVRNIVEDVKIIIATMVYSALVVVWHYECHQLIKERQPESLNELCMAQQFLLIHTG